MMVLMIYACLETSCGTWVLPKQMLPGECIADGQKIVDVWQMENPRYRVRGFTCTLPGLTEWET